MRHLSWPRPDVALSLLYLALSVLTPVVRAACDMSAVMRKCAPIQAQLPEIQQKLGRTLQIHDNVAKFTDKDFQEMRSSIDDLCKMRTPVIDCLAVLQNCPQMAQGIGDTQSFTDVMNYLCVERGLDLYTDCIAQLDGINIKKAYCAAYDDYAPPGTSIINLPTQPGEQPKKAAKVDCAKFSMYTGCMVENTKRLCGDDVASVPFRLSQFTSDSTGCPLPPKKEIVVVDYLAQKDGRIDRQTTPSGFQQRTTRPRPREDPTTNSVAWVDIGATQTPNDYGPASEDTYADEYSASLTGTDQALVAVSSYDYSDGAASSFTNNFFVISFVTFLNTIQL